MPGIHSSDINISYDLCIAILSINISNFESFGFVEAWKTVDNIQYIQ